MKEEEEASLIQRVMEDSMATHDECQWPGLDRAMALSAAGDVAIPEPKEEEEVAAFPAELVGASWGWSCTALEIAQAVGAVNWCPTPLRSPEQEASPPLAAYKASRHPPVVAGHSSLGYLRLAQTIGRLHLASTVGHGLRLATPVFPLELGKALRLGQPHLEELVIELAPAASGCLLAGPGPVEGQAFASAWSARTQAGLKYNFTNATLVALHR
ncbi:hypothetical protein D1007_03055 [Hordeum vulgare]|nr:hypothetical protein D1007_03055 [Hordeum vulgare]